ncbi:GNAT family N-acetyltransferase [Alkalihalophilus marmarensis]|uniref:Alanine acetyltransferase n=1 Tax=Alkalihalophilus marmarensis DSM 21297 TaxID=1188261 RepID=U6SPW3_9BACI|nr:GNAT family protein [Alkalihalophilus marmarensis]ERN53663.1 alanine acetyltransferase [Alkalihalophilus marmarensis DSM 21297]
MNQKKGAFPVLETKRLKLREVTYDDAADMLNYMSDPEVVRHIGLERFKSLEDAKSEIDWYHTIHKEGSGMRWGITLKGKDQLIGSCGFLNRAKKHFRAEIGTELSREYWGQGIASEAFQAVISTGFQDMQLERIEALIEPLNIASQRLAGKHGFVKEGLLRKYEYTQGKFDDLYMYSLLKEEWG